MGLVQIVKEISFQKVFVSRGFNVLFGLSLRWQAGFEVLVVAEDFPPIVRSRMIGNLADALAPPNS